MRYLAVDLGARRTGLAVGDDATGVATPLRVIEHAGGGAVLLERILAAVGEQEPDAIVVGLPLNMDGSEGAAAAKVRAFGARLEAEAGRPVRYQDERLTSFAAEQALAGSGRTRGRKRRVRDALAAARILADHLEARRDGR